MQYRDGKPTVITTGPDVWSLPSSSSAATPAEPSIHPQGADGWTAAFDSIHDIYNLSARRSSALAAYYRKHIRDTLVDLVKQGRRFGAVMMEPTCLGAGGMLFVDPLFQACLVEVVRASGDLFGGKDTEWAGDGYESRIAQVDQRDAGQWTGLPIIYDEGEDQLAVASRPWTALRDVAS